MGNRVYSTPRHNTNQDNMFEGVHNIIIKGEHFDRETCLANVLEQKVNILFGRNGSGKSTIGRAMAELANPNLAAEDKHFEKITLDRPLSDDERKSIHIFNENFIEKYVKIEDDALGPIVMLGNQVGISAQIEEKNREIQKLQSEYDVLVAENQRLNDSNDITSPLYHFARIKQKLTGVNDWAERDSKCRLNPLRRNTAIGEDTIAAIHSKLTSNPLTADEYATQKADFDAEYTTFLLTSGQTVLSLSSKTFTLPFDVDAVQEKLCEIVQKPELTEREQIIAKIASNDVNVLSQSHHLFSQESIKYCPCCFRKITAEEKLDICNRIGIILNKEVEEYTKTLFRYKSQIIPVVYDCSNLEHLFIAECSEYKSAVETYNKALASCSKLIDERLADIFGSFEKDICKDDILAAFCLVTEKYEDLKRRVASYNLAINDRRKKAVYLNDLNTVLTAHNYKSELTAYFQAKRKLELNSTKLDNKLSELDVAKAELASLNQTLEQTETALEFINECLAYVYFSRDRLVLEEGEKCYRLKSNGVYVRPGKVSLGERNIIALSYYFASLFNHLKKEDQYKNEMLLVIDDPVSSFDMENRMGVMSFLRWQVDKVIAGNSNSKILVMTHDLRVVFDLEKIVNEVTGKKRNFHELVNKSVVKRSPSEGNEYTMLYYNIYAFAKLEDPSISDRLLSMGNIMRRLLEAYFTFNYRQSFYEYVFKDEFLSMLPSDNRTYYRNLLTRLVLNGTSHEEEPVRAMTDLFALFTPQEMQMTAKSIIVLLHLLNNLHTKQYLGDAAAAEVDSWIASGFGKVNA